MAAAEEEEIGVEEASAAASGVGRRGSAAAEHGASLPDDDSSSRLNGGGGSSARKESGKVKWFSNARGFGFITPTNGGGDGGASAEDLFVHQAEVYASGFRSLQEGESVEYVVEVGGDGRSRAVSVTGPGGVHVLGSAGRHAASKGSRRRRSAAAATLPHGV